MPVLVLLGAVLMGAIVAVEVGGGLANYATRPLWPEGPLTELPTLALAAASLFVFISVGFSEELLFRGYHLTNLAEGFASRRLSPARAALFALLVSSVAFGLAHGGNPHANAVSTGNIAVAGIFLALGFDVERSEFGIDVCHRRWIVERRGAKLLDQFDAPGASVVVGADEVLKLLGFLELV